MTDERPLETGWLPDTPVDDSLLRRFLFNEAELKVLWAEAAGGRAEQRDDLVLADTGGQIPYFNQAVLLSPLDGVDDERLDAATAYFGAAGRPWTLLSAWPTPDLSTRGWVLEGHPMLVARGPWGDLTRPGDAEMVRELAASEVGEYERVLVEGYPMPGGEVPAGIVDRGVRVRVATIHGEVVAGAAGYVAHGVVNLCGAATLPSARRTGAWGALVRTRMADAPDLPAVAYTSDHSRPGFVHMGFLPVMRFTMWAR